jgi:hypothetical protein
MQMGRVLAVIFGILTIVITLAMGTNIQTYNASIQSANQTNLIGLSVLDDWGAALIIVSLLGLGGLFAVGGVTGKFATGGMKDILWVIGAVIASVVGLSLMTSVITYSNNLIGAVTTDAEDIIWGIIPLLVYIAVISISAVKTYQTARGMRKGSKAAAGAGY